MAEHLDSFLPPRTFLDELLFGIPSVQNGLGQVDEGALQEIIAGTIGAGVLPGAAVKTFGKAAASTKAKPPVSPTQNLRVTPAERKFFEEVLDSAADKKELLEQVPSLKLTNKGITVSSKEIPALQGYVDDTVRLELGTGRRVPPRFSSGKFGKPEQSSETLMKELFGGA